MAHNFTQHHHWGIIEHGIHAVIWNQQLADAFLWEFMDPHELLEDVLGLDNTKNFLARGGGFEIIDIPDPTSHFHDITIRAYHSDPRMLTWISLQKK